MTQPTQPEPIPTAQSDISLRQTVEGDRNQAIGQVLGGIVVYVSGGQAIFHSGSTESDSSAARSTPPHIGPNPYKGLMAFQETDGDRFFGREKQIAALWEKLRSLHEMESAIRVLPIYGPSGSGKSSLARAGLIPELARRPIPGYDRARVAVLVPGTHPLESLATILARIVTQDLTPVTKTREFAGELKQINETGEYDGLRRIADVMPDIAISPLVVLVDQFEEVYTLCEDKTEREAFVGNLLNAAGDRAKRVTVIVTLRSDFLGETQKHAVLNRLFSEQGYLVPAMSPEELQQAIAQPAELAGQPLDAATIDLLVKDTEGREGALPLLQFALTRVWEGLAEGKQPAETLKVIGGVGGALAGEAQRIYDSLNDDEKAIARRLFLGLVQLGEGMKDTRRRTSINSLVSYQEQLEQVKRVINRFSEPGVRLLTLASEGTTAIVEVTHEALFEYWQQLQIWLDESRSDIRFQRRLDEAARYWNEKGCPEGNLWRPPDLDLLKQYEQRLGDDMTSLQVKFFKTSVQAESKRKQLRRLGISSLVAGLLISISLGTITLFQWQRALYQRLDSLAASSQNSLPSQPITALINAVAAVGLSRSSLIHSPNNSLPPSILGSLLNSVESNNRERNLLQHKVRVRSVAISPDGKIVASGCDDGNTYLWDVTTGKQIGQPLVGHQSLVISVGFSVDGETVTSFSNDGDIRLWNIKSGKLIGQPVRMGGVFGTRIYSVSTISTDGKLLALGGFSDIALVNAKTGQVIESKLGWFSLANSASGDIITVGFDEKSGLTILRNIKTGRIISQLKLKDFVDDSIYAFAVNIDGKIIATGSASGTIQLWDAKASKPLGQPLHGHKDLINSIAFSHDGKTIISGSLDNTVRLWNVESKSLSYLLKGHKDEITAAAFSHDSKLIATGSRDSSVRLWNTQTGNSVGEPFRVSKEITSIAFSLDSNMLAGSSWDKNVYVWNVTTRQLVKHLSQQLEDEVMSVAFSPDGKTLLTVMWNGAIQFWDIKTGNSVGQTIRSNERIISATFSSDKLIICVIEHGKVYLLNAKTLKPIGQPLNAQKRKSILSSDIPVAFDEYENTIITADENGTVRLWDIQTGKLLHEPAIEYWPQIISTAINAFSRTIITGDRNGMIRFWDVNTGMPIGQPLLAHEGGVSLVVVSSDGKKVVTSDGKSLRLWFTSWEALLQSACEQLQHHSVLTEPRTDLAKEAKQTCKQYVWNK